MIKYLIIDVDGTLTDGKINISNNGEIFKSFSVKDGYAVNYILKPNGIIPIIITSRQSDIVINRCKEIGIERIYQGILNKYEKLIDIVGSDNLSKCAYFGDDILDLKCMKSIMLEGGVTGCPFDAVSDVKRNVNYICDLRAGEGAFREFSEWVVNTNINNNDLQLRINKAIEYIRNLDITKLDFEKHIVNDKFYYIVQSYKTKVETELEFESHKKNIDIQFIIKGIERIQIINSSLLKVKEDYNKNSDIIKYYDSSSKIINDVYLTTGSIITLFPKDAHKGAICIGKQNDVIKIVGKVQIS